MKKLLLLTSIVFVLTSCTGQIYYSEKLDFSKTKNEEISFLKINESDLVVRNMDDLNDDFAKYFNKRTPIGFLADTLSSFLSSKLDSSIFGVKSSNEVIAVNSDKLDSISVSTSDSNLTMSFFIPKKHPTNKRFLTVLGKVYIGRDRSEQFIRILSTFSIWDYKRNKSVSHGIINGGNGYSFFILEEKHWFEAFNNIHDDLISKTSFQMPVEK